MLLFLVLIFLLVWVILLAVAPKTSLLLIWPILLLYPQALLLGLLPFNAGIDDLCMILLALRFLLSGVQDSRKQATIVILIAVAVLVMETLSVFTGAMEQPFLLPSAVKTSLKATVLVLFTISLALGIRDQDYMRKHLISFSLACSAAYAIAFISYFYPSFSDLWQVQNPEWQYYAGTALARTYGPFGGAAEVGVVLCLTVPLSMGLLMTKPRERHITFAAWALLITSLLATLSSKSRSGIVGLSVLGVSMVLGSRYRFRVLVTMLLLLVALGIWTVIDQAGARIIAGTEARFTQQRLTTDLMTRVELWRRVFSQAGGEVFLFGMGMVPYFYKWRMSPHNGYLDALFLWGMGGVVVFCVLIGAGIKWRDSCCAMIPIRRCAARRMAGCGPTPRSPGWRWRPILGS